LSILGILRRKTKYLLSIRKGFALLSFCLFFLIIFQNQLSAQNPIIPDSVNKSDTSHVDLVFPFKDNTGNPYLDNQNSSPLFLNNPSNIKHEVIYDPKSNTYQFENKIGDFSYRTPTVMDFNEYQKYESKKDINSYWNERSQSAGTTEGSRLIPKLYVGGEAFETIFGSNTIDIRPQGSAEVSFGVLYNKRDDPALDVRQRKTTNFDFDMRIQMNVVAKIGDKIEFKANYNTESSFDFENTLKLKYEGKEDEIIKLIEAGNVSLPLKSSLIRGSQSLFGVKTELQFGKTRVTALFSQQQSETQNIKVQGGAQTNRFKITALDYEENKHFLLGHKFRDDYERAVSTLPIITSDVTITRIEVWVTNIGAATEENRNIVAFTDLGENEKRKIYNHFVNPIPGQSNPSNYSNDLLLQMDTTKIRNISTVTNYLNGDPFKIGMSQYMVAGEDYVKLENARKLKSSEYTVNTKLGFISLNTTLNPDQVLAVAYQYTIIGSNKVYQVGEFSDQGIVAPNCLVVKLLKSNTLNTKMPMWDLMMKNVYPIGAYQVQRDDFRLNLLYTGNDQGVPTGYFTKGPEGTTGIPLIHLFGLDRLDNLQNPIKGGDGLFDFIDGAAINGGTIQASNGRIFFTSLEPFGEYIRDSIFPNDPDYADFYAYDSLYTLTKTGAEQYPEKNKYILEGMYKSQSGSDISLNALNVPQGSVTVTAGGVPLVENQDYTVDYTLGRVTIINEGILNSGVPINVSLESNSFFNVQQKRMMGVHVDHEINKNFHIGGTLLNLHERPLTQKVNYGDDPVSNTMWGLDLSYRTESRWLTKIVNKLPGISSNQVSQITFDGEFAQFLPGHSKAIGNSGTSYIDDFEGAKSSIDLKHIGSWFIASTPQLQNDMFPEATNGSLDYGKNRAKLAWYIIDPLFYDRSGTLKPPNISKEELQKNSTRQVLESEVFPEKVNPNGITTNIAVLNLAYFPEERGPYNYDVDPTAVSAGVNDDGSLADPESRWGGIMRKIESSDFEAANIEYIEFWLMDPFAEDEYSGSHGDLYIDLGEISEDILRDGRKSYENGLPTSAVVKDVDQTIWGRVPKLQALVESFSNEAGSRKYQDVGYDGLSSDDEKDFHKDDYLKEMLNKFQGGQPYKDAESDPSTDDYHYYRGSDYDQEAKYASLTERYKNFNNPEGNSPTDDINPENYPTSATTLPNVEDINRDNTLSESERYFQYRIKLDSNDLKVGKNYVSDIRTGIYTAYGTKETRKVKWYQFKIPVKNPDKVVGSISDFRSIRFMRLFLRDWNAPVVLRFATFDLVRGEWRTYDKSLLSPGEYITSDEITKFNVSTVNYEENGSREPVPYNLPPGIEREVQFGTTSYIAQNEQSLSMTVENLRDGDARGVYKTTDFDFRQYKKLQMYIHAEALNEINDPKSGSAGQAYDTTTMRVFIRLGSDFTQNYYEYEVPVEFTPWGTPASQRDVIWPEYNNMIINLDQLVQVKHNRNILLRDPNNDINLDEPYVERIGKAKVTVVGSPNIGDVMGVLIGVRNPKRIGTGLDDLGDPISATVWVNELRVTDFNNKSGWAATGRMEATLADLGKVAVAASHSSAGFGSIEQKISELPLESTTDILFSTDVDWGKFFGKKAGVRIPMHYDYNSTRVTPEYNPLDPDIKLKDELDSYENKINRDSVRKLTEDYTVRQNLNFMNVRKERSNSKKKQHVYDIENFDATFAYTKEEHTNIDFDVDEKKRYRGGLGYNWNGKPKNYVPLKKVKGLNSKHLALIKDFNFYLLPKVFSFRTDMDRSFKEQLYRNKSYGDIILYPTYEKTWTWNRQYDLKYDLTKSLSVEYNAGANAYIDELQGQPEKGTPEWQDYKDTVWNSILNFGRIQRYNQTLKVNYNVPLRKIPIIDWITLAGSYTGIYSWAASPKSVQTRFGNVIENSQQLQVNSTADLSRLYNKVPYFKDITRTQSRSSRSSVRSRGTTPQPPPDTSDTTETPKKNYGKIIGDALLRILMSVQKASFNYSNGKGTSLPGFKPEPDILGVSLGENSAPGWGFVFGGQRDIREIAADNGWITKDSTLNQPFLQKANKTFSYKVNADILNAIRIDLDGDYAMTENYQSYYRYDWDSAQFINYTPLEMGNFSISYSIIKTSFVKTDTAGNSATFSNFLDMRKDVAFRLARQDIDRWKDSTYYDTIAGAVFPVGYGSNSQEVLYYSFLAAYSGQSAGSVNISSPFPTFPFPNWKITFSGLTNIEAISKIFKTFNISHGYRSMLSIASWKTNVDFNSEDPGNRFENSPNFVTKYNIGVISIIESYAPLIGLDMTFQNSLSLRAEYKKSRNLSLSFVNNQLTEVDASDITVGLGYRLKDLKFTIGSLTGVSKRQKTHNSDLNLKLDFGIRDSKTTLRRIDENNNQISSGARQYNLNFSADYMLSQSLQVRLFLNWTSNSPYISSQFPNSTTNGGISLRFNLAQ